MSSQHPIPCAAEGTAAEASKALPPLPHPGDRVLYRCRGLGMFYPADVRAVGADGLIDIEVGMQIDLTLSKLPWWTGAKEDCPRGACVPK